MRTFCRMFPLERPVDVGFLSERAAPSARPRLIKRSIGPIPLPPKVHAMRWPRRRARSSVRYLGRIQTVIAFCSRFRKHGDFPAEGNHASSEGPDLRLYSLWGGGGTSAAALRSFTSALLTCSGTPTKACGDRTCFAHCFCPCTRRHGVAELCRTAGAGFACLFAGNRRNPPALSPPRGAAPGHRGLASLASMATASVRPRMRMTF